jgi:hypothetical protein
MKIIQNQKQRGVMRHICITEHGPEPYQIWPDRTVSETEKSKALWDINTTVKDLVTRRYSMEHLPKPPSAGKI